MSGWKCKDCGAKVRPFDILCDACNEINSAMLRAGRPRERAIRAVVAAQWMVMITWMDWCYAFAIDPEIDHPTTEWWKEMGRPWVIADNTAALPTAEQIVDGTA